MQIYDIYLGSLDDYVTKYDHATKCSLFFYFYMKYNMTLQYLSSLVPQYHCIYHNRILL